MSQQSIKVRVEFVVTEDGNFERQAIFSNEGGLKVGSLVVRSDQGGAVTSAKLSRRQTESQAYSNEVLISAGYQTMGLLTGRTDGVKVETE